MSAGEEVYLGTTFGLTGRHYDVGGRAMDLPQYDPDTREHFWSVAVLYHIKRPEPGGTGYLDQENLVNIAGPACWHCEEDFSEEVASRPCPGGR